MVKTIGNVQEDGQVRAVASGALSNGDTVIVNSNGTVSVVSGNDEGAGTPATISNDASPSFILAEVQAVYDSVNNKVVVAYYKDTTGYYGKAAVGTISGSSISFGTPVTFISASLEGLGLAYDSNEEKIFISFVNKDNSSYLTGVVGTVSGTSISFGTNTVFYSSSVSKQQCAFDSTNNKILSVFRQGNGFGVAKVVTISGNSISSGNTAVFNTGNIGDPSLAFSTSAGKFVLVYSDSDQSSHSQYIVGTISGTSVSFGTEGDMNNVSSARNEIAYDSSTDKFIAVYQDAAASFSGKARVGTLSGTTVSWGSIAVFNSGSTTFPAVATNNNGKAVITYTDLGNSGYPTFVSAEISGTTLTIGSENVIEAVNSESGAIIGKSLPAYDSSAGKFAYPYTDVTNSLLEAAVLQLASTNLTSDNFIGFADGSYADTQSAAINSTCSVDDNQTGLTAGQKYYVQSDGTLSTTAGSPTVEAGTAISPTKILVKG